MKSLLLLSAILSVLCGLSVLSWKTCAAAEFDFEKQVAPILAKHCVTCHNGSDPKSGLNLTTRESALKGGDAGEVIIPGKPAESRLIERVTDGSMPPEHDGRRLNLP